MLWGWRIDRESTEVEEVLFLQVCKHLLHLCRQGVYRGGGGAYTLEEKAQETLETDLCQSPEREPTNLKSHSTESLYPQPLWSLQPPGGLAQQGLAHLSVGPSFIFKGFYPPGGQPYLLSACLAAMHKK